MDGESRGDYIIDSHVFRYLFPRSNFRKVCYLHQLHYYYYYSHYYNYWFLAVLTSYPNSLCILNYLDYLLP